MHRKPKIWQKIELAVHSVNAEVVRTVPEIKTLKHQRKVRKEKEEKRWVRLAAKKPSSIR